MNPALIAAIAQLASQGISAYAQVQQSKTAAQAAAAIKTAGSIYANLQQIGDVLSKAQGEGWADDDPRWQAVFDVADKALAAAEGRLDAPGT